MTRISRNKIKYINWLFIVSILTLIYFLIVWATEGNKADTWLLHIIRSQNKQKIKTGGFYTIVDYPYSQWCKTQHFIAVKMMFLWKALRKEGLNSQCA